MTKYMHVIPTGVDTKRFSPEHIDLNTVLDLRSEYGLQGKYCLGYVGRIAAEKNVGMIMECLPQLFSQMPDMLFVVTGYGPDLENLKKKAIDLNIADRVVFTGKQPPSQIQNFYAICDAFITASTSETQGITYVEAMAAGLPVIAKYDDALKPILTDGVTGFTFTNQKELCDAVRRCYSLDKDAYAAMSKNCLNKADEYSLQTFGTNVVNVYYQAIARKQRMLERRQLQKKAQQQVTQIKKEKKGRKEIIMYYIGVDLGGTNIAIGLVDANGHIQAKKSIKTLAQRPFEEIMRDMADGIVALLSEQDVDLAQVNSIGIASPGSLNTADGILVCAYNFKDGINVPMRKLLQKYIDKPVFIGNDANAAALGEVVAGAAKGYKDVVMITLGTGVGGGIIINGKIYEGYRSAGAELGHLILEHNGKECTCGRRGCWEAYASATALIEQTKQAIAEHPESAMAQVPSDKVDGRTAFDAMRAGDVVAKQVVDTYIEYIGEGIVDLVNIFRPELLIIGGGICNEGKTLLDPLCAFVHKYSFGGSLNAPQRIEVASLGNDAGIIGAAMLGRV